MSINIGIGIPSIQRALRDPITTAILNYGGFWLDPSYENALELNTQPTPTDWDMEADGYANWTPTYGGATGSKQTGSPSGVGSQVLRGVQGSTPGGWVENAPTLILGNRYTVSCWARGDGASTKAGLGDSNYGFRWGQSTTSTTWQRLSGEATAGATAIILQMAGGGEGGWAEMDDIQATNLSVKKVEPRLTSAAYSTLEFAQNTAANMPWNDGTGLRGVNDYLACNIAAANWKFLSDGSACSLYFVATPDAAQDGVWMVLGGTTDSASRTPGILLRRSNLNKITVLVRSNADWVILDVGGGSMVGGATYVVDYHCDGAKGWELYLNGTKVGSGSDVAYSGTPTKTLYLMSQSESGSYPWIGRENDVVCLAGKATDSEKASIRQYLADKHSVTLA